MPFVNVSFNNTYSTFKNADAPELSEFELSIIVLSAVHENKLKMMIKIDKYLIILSLCLLFIKYYV